MNCFLDVVTEDKHGALARIVGVFASLGLNIEHLTAFPSAHAGFTDVRVRVKADESMLRTLSRKLRRIVTVVEVQGSLEPSEPMDGRLTHQTGGLEEASAAAF